MELISLCQNQKFLSPDIKCGWIILTPSILKTSPNSLHVYFDYDDSINEQGDRYFKVV